MVQLQVTGIIVIRKEGYLPYSGCLLILDVNTMSEVWLVTSLLTRLSVKAWC